MSNHWLQSHNGRRIDLLDVEENIYDTEDIAIQLSRQNRFNGATLRPYSVLEHTLLGYHLFFNDGEPEPTELALAWLLHDAAEAYLGDMPSPLKSLCPGYREIEARLAEDIYDFFGADFSLWRSNEIEYIDTQMLILERAALMTAEPQSWGDWADWGDYDYDLSRDLRSGPVCASHPKTYQLCLNWEI